MFRKFGSLTTALGTAEYSAGDGLLRRIASADTAAVATPRVATSYYLDGARALDVRGLLERVAATYATSADPTDYVFEAIRANTTNAPNENSDGFHQAELLRFDLRLGMPVYATYTGKPHHVNHVTVDPKTARGVILDAHYNTDTPFIETCPRCAAKTAARQNRDETGLHCKKCGALVGDEFVEILVGIDTVKDPQFARGVVTGQLNAGSMGCSCASTVCNVCSHVAYSKPEFCEHIRAGNKGSLWLRQGSRWVKTNPYDAGREFKRRGYTFSPSDFCYAKGDDGFEVRKAFEYCQGVIFDEYSRVDQPADPKALTREFIRAAHTGDAGTDRAAVMKQETEALIRAAEARHQKAAQSSAARRFFVVRVNNDPADTHAAETAEAALALAMPDPGDALEVSEVSAPDAGAARLMWDDATARPFDREGVEVTPGPGEEVVVNPPEGSPGALGPAPLPPLGIDDYSEQEMNRDLGTPAPGEPEQLSPAELGVMPPGAEKEATMQLFKNAFKGWSIDVSQHGNATLKDAKGTPVLIVRAEKEMPDVDARVAFGSEVLKHAFSEGLTMTANKYKGIYTPKFAQVVEHAIDDMQGFEDKYMYDNLNDAGVETDDMAGDTRQGPPPESSLESANEGEDMSGDVRGEPPASTTEERTTDHELGEALDPSSMSVTDEDHGDMRDKREPKDLGDSVLESEIHDHKERLAFVPNIGARVAHKTQPEVAWTIEAADQKQGWITVKNEAGQKRRVSHTDLMDYWRSLDKAAQMETGESGVTHVWYYRHDGAWAYRADNAEGFDHSDVVGVPDDASVGDVEAELARQFPGAEIKETNIINGAVRRSGAENKSTADARSIEARYKKLTAAKIAQVKAEADAKIAAAQAATVDSFVRAMRIVAKRFAADLETAPIKQAAEAVLAEPRYIGTDAATGEPIPYHGMDAELVRYLAAQIYDISHEDHLKALTDRAAALMKKGDQYLLDAEADLENFKTRLPKVTSARVSAPVDEVALRAAEVRAQARQGNLAVNPSPYVEAVDSAFDKRAQIRGALGGTLVNGQLDRLRHEN